MLEEITSIESEVIAHSPGMLDYLRSVSLSPAISVVVEGDEERYELPRVARLALALGLIILKLEAEKATRDAN